MIKNEMIVVTVPSAYRDGEVTLSVMLQISSGNVLSEPDGLQRAGRTRRTTRVKPNSATATQARRQDRNRQRARWSASAWRRDRTQLLPKRDRSAT